MTPETILNTIWRPMGEDEILLRVREAWIATHRAGPWRSRRARAGQYDHRLTAAIRALRDTSRTMPLILSDRAEATVAITLRITPGITDQNREVVADAVMTALLLELVR